MRRNRVRIRPILIIGVFLTLLVFFFPKHIGETPITLQPELHTVTYVIDGDTIIVDGKTTVRYIGINTPEIQNKYSSKTECYGKEAFQRNKSLVLGQSVKLLKDKSETDKYGRLLRYVYVNGLFVNNYLMLNGYARAEPVKPDILYA